MATNQPSLLANRFELLDKLGEGGMGVVYAARDREREMKVALKTLRHFDAQHLYLFKREFRLLANLSHPNIVNLYEMVADGDDWFLTMEIVKGCNMLRYVRPSLASETATAEAAQPTSTLATEDASGKQNDTVTVASRKASSKRESIQGVVKLDRLHHCLAQLAKALSTLHASGLVHRDLKPSNVQVTSDGRLVLMDFGIVADLRNPESGGLSLGTPAYMAPEQAAGDAPTSAADWYSFGVMLYEALTGRRPFEGDRQLMLVAKQRHDPLPPHDLSDDIPADLEDLCMRLLSRAPEDRPRGDQVLQALGIKDGPGLDTTSTGPGVFIGRKAELSQLHAIRKASQIGDSQAVLLAGESSIGKSALLDHFCLEVETGDAQPKGEAPLILRGRCHERESLAYKALDGLIDSLSVELADLPKRRLRGMLPEDFDLVARLFPVLLRVPGADRRISRHLDPIGLRDRAFAALRSLLHSITEWRPLVLIIDDVQWADRDSTDLLIALLRAPLPERLLLIASTRSDSAGDAGKTLANALAERMPLSRIELGPLSTEEQGDLIEELGRRAPPRKKIDEGLWKEAGGNPLLLVELARFLADPSVDLEGLEHPGLEEMTRHRMARLPPEALRLLEILVIGAEALPLSLVGKAIDLGGDARERAAAELRVARLARIARPGHEPWLMPYHESVRESVLAMLDEERRLQLHHRLALNLEHWDKASADTLARHWLASGDRDQATRYLARAAEAAQDKLAFDRAVELYRAALDLSSESSQPSRQTLLCRLADALIFAGHGHEAASFYDEAIPNAAPEQALELERLAAECVLRAGHIDEGLTRLSNVMDKLGAPFARTRKRAVGALIMDRLRLLVRGGLRYKATQKAELSPRRLARLDTLYAASAALAIVDHIRGSAVQARHLLLALQAGEEHRVCRALVVESGFLVAQTASWKGRGARLCRDSVLMARRLEDPLLIATALSIQGLAEMSSGQLRIAQATCTEAVRILRDEVPGLGFETFMARYLLIIAQINRGDFNRLEETTEELIVSAEQRNDRFASSFFQMVPKVWLAIRDDDPDAAEHAALVGLEGWPEEPYYLQHFARDYARVLVASYRGDVDKAWEELLVMLPKVRSIMIHRMPLQIAMIYFFQGNLAIQRRDFRTSKKMAKRLARYGPRGFLAIADMLRALEAHWRGDKIKCERLLADAIAGMDFAGLDHAVACCRIRLGESVGGHSGQRLIETGEAWMAEQRVANPAAIVNLFFPRAPAVKQLA